MINLHKIIIAIIITKKEEDEDEKKEEEEDGDDLLVGRRLSHQKSALSHLWSDQHFRNSHLSFADQTF